MSIFLHRSGILGRGQSGGGGGGASTIDTDYTVDELVPVWLSYGANTDLIVPNGTGGDLDLHIRELGNVLDEGTPGSQRYKLFYSGHTDDLEDYDSATTEVFVFYAYSSDGENWTKGGRLVLGTTGASPEDGRKSEDPYVVKHGGTYYCYVEDLEPNPFTSIRLYTSTDFSTWTDQGDVLSPGAASAWDEQDVSSPTVWIEGGTWYMLYEGRGSAGQEGAVGLATSSDGITWTKDGANPIFHGTEFASPQVSWAEHVVPDDIRKASNGDYVLSFHGQSASGNPFVIGMASGPTLYTMANAIGERAVRVDFSLETRGQNCMFGPSLSGVDYVYARVSGSGIRQGVDMGTEILSVNFTGPDASTSFTDDSLWGQTLTAHGNAQIQSNKLELDGSGDYVSVPDSDKLDFGGRDFTVELFGVVFDTVGSSFSALIGQFDGGDTANSSWRLDWRGDLSPDRLRLLYRDSSNVFFANDSSSWTPTAGTAYDICVERSGSTWRFYIDGTMHGSFTTSAALQNATQSLYIGAGRNGGSVVGAHDGKIAAVRINSGAALYASDGGYTVPSLPL